MRFPFERLTKDIDLAVVVSSDQHAEEVVRGLVASGYRVKTLVEQTRHGRIATVRLTEGVEGTAFVDLLFASSGIEPEIEIEAEWIDIFPELPVKTASLPGLIALKVLSADSDTRPQDELDLKHLIAVADEPALLRAKGLLELIERRGYKRQKNLKAEFSGYVKRFRG